MRILVLGTARSGTSLMIEVIRGLEIVQLSKKVEDRKFFKYKEVPENYGTKLQTERKYFTMENIKKSMEKYKDLYLVFIIRHPLDNYLSKIRRGAKTSQGGDRPGGGEWIADDGTHETAIQAIKGFYFKYKSLKVYYPNRVFSVKLEDLLLSPHETVRRVAKFFGVKAKQKAFEFWKYNRNKYHQRRYKKKLDKSQIGLYKKWDTVYEGFFRDWKENIEKAKEDMSLIIEDLGYRL